MNKTTKLWAAAIDLLIDGVLGPLWLSLTLVLFACRLVLSPIFGLGLLPMTFARRISRLICLVERERAMALYEIEIAPQQTAVTAHEGGRQSLGRALVTTIDPVTGRLLLHHLLSAGMGLVFLALGVFAFNLVVRVDLFFGWLPGALTLIAALSGLVGYVWLVGRIDREVVSNLLGRSERTQLLEQIGTLAQARRGAVDGAALERARIERDLHDGLQPRLVSVALSIGMATNKLDSDPIGARALLDQAHADAKSSIVELRELARGIHPAVLMDRGLDAALSAIAARCPIPITLDVTLPARLRSDVEAVIYFTVTEALTNVAKHSDARSCAAVVSQHGSVVVAMVTDDGVGGARVGAGLGRGGLSGMSDRALAAGGTVKVDSPHGGPTVITVQIPCE